MILERDRGEFRPSYGPKDAGKGDLHLTYRTTNNRKVAVLQLLGADKGWHMQEWICTTLPAI